MSTAQTGKHSPREDPAAWWDVTSNTKNWWDELYLNQRRHIQNGLELRYSLLERATERLSESIKQTGLSGPVEAGVKTEFSIPSLCVWQLATIDVFVEKAQHFLTERADKQECYGKWTTFATLLAMASSFSFAYLNLKDFGDANGWSGIIHFLAFVTVLAPLLGVSYFFVSLTRAFFHEATILRNRRHSVRLGRLLLHLKVSSASSPDALAKIIDRLDITEMQNAFGWNLETSTAFKDINAAAMTTDLIAQITAKFPKGGTSKEPEPKPPNSEA